MEKVIKYKYLSCQVNVGTEEKPIMQPLIINKSISWNEANEEIAKEEAYNGEYIIEEVEPVEKETLEERTAALEEALTLLLEGVTEWQI